MTDHPLPTSNTRRRFLLNASALTSVLALPTLAACSGDGAAEPFVVTPPADPLVVSTTTGRYRGVAYSRVNAWLGVPYAQAPVGALRFRAPKPVAAHTGIRDADRFGLASLQLISPAAGWIYPPNTVAAQGEDCLTLNVWAPQRSSDAPLPVFVWLHGGAWRTGATRVPLMDGQAIASRGVIVVTANFRLGGMGSLAHPDLRDADNGSVANWQLQDQIAVLQWVQQNIEAFGGDPSRVTVAGQSAGGTSVALMALYPEARACMHKAVLLSPSPIAVPGAFNLADAAIYTELVASRLGTTVQGLRNVGAAELHSAELAQNALPLPAGVNTGRQARAAAVLDGQFYRTDWVDAAWPTDLSVMVTSTLTEGSFWYDLVDPASGRRLTPALPTTRLEVLQRAVAQIGSETVANDAVDRYVAEAEREGRNASWGDIWIDIYSDYRLRYPAARFAARAARAGGDVRYGTYMHPVKSPGHGVPHCADLPMYFGTNGLDDYRDKVGAGSTEAALSESMISTLVSFIRDGRAELQAGSLAPSTWPRYQPDVAGTSVRIGEAGRQPLEPDTIPHAAELAVWDRVRVG